MSAMIQTLYKSVEQNTFNIAKNIKLLICDVDGVFSDGRIYMGNNGEELKTFHTRDGYGVKSLMNAGIEVAITTGRKSNIVENRMNALGISLIYQGQEDKLEAYHDICDKLKVSPQHIGYIGDDLIASFGACKRFLDGLQVTQQLLICDFIDVKKHIGQIDIYSLVHFTSF